MSSSSSARARRVGVVAALACSAAAVPAAPAQAASPRVTVTVIGPQGQAIRMPRAVRAGDARIRVEGRSCPLPGATPLAALRATRLPLRVTAGGSCSPSAYYVTTIGRRAAYGRSGWTYKVGRRAGTTSAASPSGSFGTGRRLRSGDVVTWFWCVLGRRGCQRTLAARRVSTTSVRVMAYDDDGRGIRVRRALVTVRSSSGGFRRARTNASGIARVRGLRGSWRITARRSGFVPALPGGHR